LETKVRTSGNLVAEDVKASGNASIELGVDPQNDKPEKWAARSLIFLQ
jgi:hypothetical protein